MQKKFLLEYEMDYNRRKQHTDKITSGLDHANANDNTTLYTASSSIISAALKKKALLSPILKSPSKEDPDHIDWQTNREYRDLKVTVQESSLRLQNVLGKLTSPSDSPEPTNRKKSRQPSPYLQSSRPLSGVSPDHQTSVAGMKTTDSFARVIKGMDKDIEYMKKHDPHPQAATNPNWDHRFVFGNALSPITRPMTADVHLRHKKFVQKMAQYKTSKKQQIKEQQKTVLAMSESVPTERIIKQRSYSSPSPTSKRDKDSSNNHEQINRSSSRDRVRDSTPVKLQEDSIRFITPDYFFIDEGIEQIDEEQEPPVDPRLLKAVEDLWNHLIKALHRCGESILYPEILEVAILRDPPDFLAAVIGYIALLMGLKPVWKTIKTTLLKECNIFQNFIREVDPLDIPARRVIKAFLYKDDKLTNTDATSITTICRPAGKIMSWVMCFQPIAKIIAAVAKDERTERKRHQKENYPFVMVPTAFNNSVDRPSSRPASPSRAQKEQRPLSGISRPPSTLKAVSADDAELDQSTEQILLPQTGETDDNNNQPPQTDTETKETNVNNNNISTSSPLPTLENIQQRRLHLFLLKVARNQELMEELNISLEELIKADRDKLFNKSDDSFYTSEISDVHEVTETHKKEKSESNDNYEEDADFILERDNSEKKLMESDAIQQLIGKTFQHVGSFDDVAHKKKAHGHHKKHRDGIAIVVEEEPKGDEKDKEDEKKESVHETVPLPEAKHDLEPKENTVVQPTHLENHDDKDLSYTIPPVVLKVAEENPHEIKEDNSKADNVPSQNEQQEIKKKKMEESFSEALNVFKQQDSNTSSAGENAVKTTNDSSEHNSARINEDKNGSKKDTGRSSNARKTVVRHPFSSNSQKDKDRNDRKYSTPTSSASAYRVFVPNHQVAALAQKIMVDEYNKSIHILEDKAKSILVKETSSMKELTVSREPSTKKMTEREDSRGRLTTIATTTNTTTTEEKKSSEKEKEREKEDIQTSQDEHEYSYDEHDFVVEVEKGPLKPVEKKKSEVFEEKKEEKADIVPVQPPVVVGVVVVPAEKEKVKEEEKKEFEKLQEKEKPAVKKEEVKREETKPAKPVEVKEKEEEEPNDYYEEEDFAFEEEESKKMQEPVVAVPMAKKEETQATLEKEPIKVEKQPAMVVSTAAVEKEYKNETAAVLPVVNETEKQQKPKEEEKQPPQPAENEKNEEIPKENEKAESLAAAPESYSNDYYDEEFEENNNSNKKDDDFIQAAATDEDEKSPERIEEVAKVEPSLLQETVKEKEENITFLEEPTVAEHPVIEQSQSIEQPAVAKQETEDYYEEEFENSNKVGQFEKIEPAVVEPPTIEPVAGEEKGTEDEHHDENISTVQQEKKDVVLREEFTAEVSLSQEALPNKDDRSPDTPPVIETNETEIVSTTKEKEVEEEEEGERKENYDEEEFESSFKVENATLTDPAKTTEPAQEEDEREDYHENGKEEVTPLVNAFEPEEFPFELSLSQEVLSGVENKEMEELLKAMALASESKAAEEEEEEQRNKGMSYEEDEFESSFKGENAYEMVPAVATESDERKTENEDMSSPFSPPPDVGPEPASHHPNQESTDFKLTPKVDPEGSNTIVKEEKKVPNDDDGFEYILKEETVPTKAKKEESVHESVIEKAAEEVKQEEGPPTAAAVVVVVLAEEQKKATNEDDEFDYNFEELEGVVEVGKTTATEKEKKEFVVLGAPSPPPAEERITPKEEQLSFVSEQPKDSIEPMMTTASEVTVIAKVEKEEKPEKKAEEQKSSKYEDADEFDFFDLEETISVEKKDPVLPERSKEKEHPMNPPLNQTLVEENAHVTGDVSDPIVINKEKEVPVDDKKGNYADDEFDYFLNEETETPTVKKEGVKQVVTNVERNTEVVAPGFAEEKGEDKVTNQEEKKEQLEEYPSSPVTVTKEQEVSSHSDSPPDNFRREDSLASRGRFLSASSEKSLLAEFPSNDGSSFSSSPFVLSESLLSVMNNSQAPITTLSVTIKDIRLLLDDYNDSFVASRNLFLVFKIGKKTKLYTRSHDVKRPEMVFSEQFQQQFKNIDEIMNDPGSLLQMTISLYDKGVHGNELIGVNKECHLLQLLQKNEEFVSSSSNSFQLRFHSSKTETNEELKIQLKFDLITSISV